MEIKAAYIVGGATILAAAIGFLGNTYLETNTKKPSTAVDGDGNQVNVVQSGGDVTISQSVNEISKLREYEAKSLQQSLISGCETMLDYFANRKNFNVDSIDTLIGSIWVQKEKYVSFFGSESQRNAMDMVDRINPLYIEWMPGVFALHNSEKTGMSATSQVTQSMLKNTDRAQPELVAESERLCSHLRSMTLVKQ